MGVVEALSGPRNSTAITLNEIFGNNRELMPINRKAKTFLETFLKTRIALANEDKEGAKRLTHKMIGMDGVRMAQTLKRQTSLIIAAVSVPDIEIVYEKPVDGEVDKDFAFQKDK